MSSKSYSTSVTTSSDNRVQLDSTGGGKFVAPQAVSTDPGSFAISGGDYSTISMSAQNLKMGMSGSEVKDLLEQQGTLAAEQLASVADYSKAAIAAVTETKATELATASGESVTLQKYVPLTIGATVLMVLLWRRK